VNSNLQNLIDLALQEDLPQGDVTTDPLDCEKTTGKAKLVAKGDIFLSGTEAFEQTFKKIDSQCQIIWKFRDGDEIKKGEVVCVIEASLPTLLKAERTALNFLGHLSGIATLTSKFVKEVSGTKTLIIDTRKTMPGFRALEKAAVRHGGGKNHRMSLSDGVLIKENHIRAVGSISSAIKKIRGLDSEIPIEVEVTNPDEIKEALDMGASRLLLDNMSLKEMALAVKQIGKRALIEASGNMTLDRVKSVAKLGVNFISVGSLTHSAPSADLSMLFEEEGRL
jgi:nicotinate-nucleotide pyrophosphorylase (carboxylating)